METPWDVSLGAVEKALGVKVEVEDFEHHPDQVFRYMAGKGLVSAKGFHAFTPGMTFFFCERLEDDFTRTWQAVQAARPTKRT